MEQAADEVIVGNSSSSSSLSRSVLVRRLLQRRVPSRHVVSGEDEEEDFLGRDEPIVDVDEFGLDRGDSSSSVISHDDNEEDNGSDSVGGHSRHHNSTSSTFTTKSTPGTPPRVMTMPYSPLETLLPSDTSSHILSYLHPYELFKFSLVSKRAKDMFHEELVWKNKFVGRWNCIPDMGHCVVGVRDGEISDVNGESSSNPSTLRNNNFGFWKRCYINAYRNPHDLWIRHWNCVYPEDVTTCPGRTVIPDVRFEGGGNYYNWFEKNGKQTSSSSCLNQSKKSDCDECNNSQQENTIEQLQRDFDSPSLQQCPTCRYHPMVHPCGCEDVIDAVEKELKFSRSESNNADSDQHTSSPLMSGDEHDNDSREGHDANTISVSGSGITDPVEHAETVAASHALLSDPMYKRDNAATYDMLGPSAAARAIHYSTLYSIAKCCRNMNNAGRWLQENGNKIDKGCRIGNNASASILNIYHNTLHPKNVPTDKQSEQEQNKQTQHNQKEETAPTSTAAVAAAAAAAAAIQVRNNARLAFSCASTHGRQLRTDQYRSSGLEFMTDALFFDVRSEEERKGGNNNSLSLSLRRRLCQRLDSGGGATAKKEEFVSPIHSNDSSGDDAVSRLGPSFETSHHSWHILRLTNPEFVLRITFRAYVQSEGDDFTIYPAQGMIMPGETVYLVLGLRAGGSLRNEAFEEEERDVDEVGGRRRATAARHCRQRLPLVPFAIRYMFAPPMACMPHDYAPRPPNSSNSEEQQRTAASLFGPATAQQPPRPQDPANLLPASVIDHLWDNVTASADVRTLYISAHVHSRNYEFEEFQCATLMPFDIVATKTSKGMECPLTTVMPCVQQRDAVLFSMLQNLSDEIIEENDSSINNRTEGRCELCQRKWGAQSELLGRAYILKRLDVETRRLVRERRRIDFERTLGMVPSLLRKSLPSLPLSEEEEEEEVGPVLSISRLNRVSQLLFCLYTDYLQKRIADKFVSREEMALNVAYASYIDETYADIQNCLPPTLRPDIREGVSGPKFFSQLLRRCRCELDGRDQMAWRSKHKERPGGAIRTGSFFLGELDDPNHQQKGKSKGESSSSNMHTDMFQNDPYKAFAGATAVIFNPVRVSHCVYDRVKKPGAIVTRPSLPIDAYFRPRGVEERDGQTLLTRVINLLERSSAAARETGWRKRGWRPSPSLPLQRQRRWSYFKSINYELNDIDADSLGLITFGQRCMQINFQTSMTHILGNIPLPGRGPFVLTSPRRTGMSDDRRTTSILGLYTKVRPYSHLLFPVSPEDERIGVDDEEQRSALNHQRSSNHRNPQHPEEQGIDNNNINPELNILWLIARHFGWVVDDEENRGSLLIDRRLLIATQWLSNTLMVFSLLASLLSRKFELISPIDVRLQGMRVGFWQDVYMLNLPFGTSVYNMSSRTRSSRFWSNEECGFAAILVLVFYFVLGRMSERQIGRSYERELTEASECSVPKRRISRYMQLLWDNTCPLFLQQRLYLGTRSQGSDGDVLNRAIYLRSEDGREYCRSRFNASGGRGNMRVEVPLRELSLSRHSVGLAFFVLSFSACSPHFVVNSLTVFSCGLSYGMSLSLESMEIVRRTTSSGVLTMIKPRRLDTLVIGFITVGQLVGSSGGIVFLAEFIVTSVSLLLGGAATITSRTLDSWITFFCLSSTAFWGFVFARLGLLDGMRNKRRGIHSIPSALLCASLCSAMTMWAIVLTHVDWYSLSPGSLVVHQIRDFVSEMKKKSIR